MHIARGRLANPKRDLPSYLSKQYNVNLLPVSMDLLVVDAEKCVAELDAAHIALGRLAHP